MPLFSVEELFPVGDDDSRGSSNVDFDKKRVAPHELDRPNALRHTAQSPELHVQCDEGMTALMHAVLDGNKELTRLLLAYAVSSSSGGAIYRDPDFFHSVAQLQDNVFGGVTVFHIAVQRGNEDILGDLLQCAKVSRSDAVEIAEFGTGYTPLQKAVLLVRRFPRGLGLPVCLPTELYCSTGMLLRMRSLMTFPFFFFFPSVASPCRTKMHPFVYSLPVAAPMLRTVVGSGCRQFL